jgi:hypothetical protein
MTAVCGRCGEVYWSGQRHKCSRRRSCDHLPRSRYARLEAQIAELRADHDALDRGVVEASVAGDRALRQITEVRGGVAFAFTAARLPVPAALRPSRPVPGAVEAERPALTLHQGGAA